MHIKIGNCRECHCKEAPDRNFRDVASVFSNQETYVSLSRANIHPIIRTKTAIAFTLMPFFVYCVKFDCVTKCPPRSNLTTPPKEIILLTDLEVTPEELDGMQNFPILSR